MSVCIIIGAGPGVGEAIARRFGKGGFRLGLVARNADKLSQQAERLRDIGLSSHWLRPRL